MGRADRRRPAGPARPRRGGAPADRRGASDGAVASLDACPATPRSRCGAAVRTAPAARAVLRRAPVRAVGGLRVRQARRAPVPAPAADFRCGIHADLRPAGSPGARSYECFGAGQHVTQERSAGALARRPCAWPREMFAVFPVMRGTCTSCSAYLTEAIAIPDGGAAARRDRTRSRRDRGDAAGPRGWRDRRRRPAPSASPLLERVSALARADLRDRQAPRRRPRRGPDSAAPTCAGPTCAVPPARRGPARRRPAPGGPARRGPAGRRPARRRPVGRALRHPAAGGVAHAATRTTRLPRDLLARALDALRHVENREGGSDHLTKDAAAPGLASPNRRY